MITSQMMSQVSGPTKIHANIQNSRSRAAAVNDGEIVPDTVNIDTSNNREI